MPTKSTKPRRKSNSGNKQTTTIKIRDIKNNRGKIEFVGEDKITNYVTNGLSGNEIKRLFADLYTQLEASKTTSHTIKGDAKEQVKEIQASITDAANKNEQVDEGFLARRFRNIARMGPDILDLVVKTLANPVLGITDLINKIAIEANKETGSH